MFSVPMARWLQRKGVHYAWLMALMAFLTMLSSAAAIGLPGTVLQPISKEFGWATSEISSALALRLALFGLIGPFAAIFMERFGLRRMVCAAMLVIASGLLVGSQVHALWQFVVLWGVVLGIGSGLTALVLGAMVANRWFEKRRGLVIGMLTASTATGQLVFLPLSAWLVEHYGWRMAVVPVCAMCLLAALLAFCFMRSRPQDLGLQPYGAPPAAVVVPVPAAPMAWSTPLTILRSVFASPMFWLLFGTFFVCGLSTNGLIQTHFISLCGDYGLSPVPAASVLAMMGAFDFFGTIFSGWLSDRVNSRKLLFWYYGLRGLSLFWLPHSTFTLYGLSFFALFYGLDWVATVPPTVKLANNTFGKEKAPMVFGWIFAGHQLGGAVAAYGAGLSRTVLLSYTPALYAAGAACLCAAIAVLWVNSSGKPKAQLVTA